MNQKSRKLLCPLCNNSEHEVLFAARDADRLRAEPFEVVRCTKCNLVATRPFLNDEALSIWYRPRYHGWWKEKKWHPFSFIIKIFQKNRLKYITQNMTDAIRLIDIGCGDGTFIEYMESRGFEVSGIENPELFPQAAEQFLGVDLNRETSCVFRSKADTHSDSFRTVIPIQSGHPFRFISDTHSNRIRTVLLGCLDYQI